MAAAVVPSSTNVDRRSAPRRQPAVGTVFRIEDAAEERGFGLVWNISTSGISMLTPDNPGCGAKLRGNIVTNDGRHRQPDRVADRARPPDRDWRSFPRRPVRSRR